MAVSSSTPVQLSMGQFVGGLLGIAGFVLVVGWGMVAFGTGAIKDDVGNIRTDLNSIKTSLETSTKAFQNADKDGILRLGESERRLADQIAGLRTDLVGLRSDLSSTTKTMTTFGSQLAETQKQMQLRQVSFNDPRMIENLAAALKKAGVEGGKIVIVPLDPSTFVTPK
jgi:hypothetical protein